MADAVVADDAAKARFKTEGRQLYVSPVNPAHNPFPELRPYERGPRSYPADVPYPEIPGEGQPFLWPLTLAQLEAVHDMFAEGDMRRGRASSAEEMERSIALCQRALGKVPGWMIMARDLLREERRKKYAGTRAD